MRVTRVPTRKALGTLPPYVPGARVPVGAAAFKLSSNENPFPPLPSVMAAIADAGVDVNRYPDMYASELVEAVAAHLGVESDEVVMGGGSVAVLGQLLPSLKTLVWNGPFGAFETPPFDAATVAVAKAVAAATETAGLRSVAGGGDTVSALRQAGVIDRLSYVSSAGGAILEWLEGKTLPGVAALEG